MNWIQISSVLCDKKIPKKLKGRLYYKLATSSEDRNVVWIWLLRSEYDNGIEDEYSGVKMIRWMCKWLERI